MNKTCRGHCYIFLKIIQTVFFCVTVQCAVSDEFKLAPLYTIAKSTAAEQIKKERFAVPAPLMNLQKLLFMSPSDNIRVVRTAFMEKWGRNPGRERWEMQPLDFSADLEKKIWVELDALGMVNALEPSQKKYDYVLVFAATIPVMIKRYEYLIDLYNKGLRFRRLSILATQRPINRTLEGSPTYFKQMKRRLPCHQGMLPKNEAEAAKMIYRCIDLPKELEKIAVDFYDVPRAYKVLRWQRPSTKEVVIEWINNNRKKGSVLAISSQPYALYQYTVLRSEVRSSFSIEVVAPKVDPTLKIEVALDAVASWLEYYNNKLIANPATDVGK